MLLPGTQVTYSENGLYDEMDSVLEMAALVVLS
jgi:hypothetical protein